MIERRFRPGVTHALCTQMNGECVGYHCPECGQGCSSQGHFGRCDPEQVAIHQAWLRDRTAPEPHLLRGEN